MRASTIIVAGLLAACVTAVPFADEWVESTAPGSECLDQQDELNLAVALTSLSSDIAAKTHLQSALQLVEETAPRADTVTKLRALHKEVASSVTAITQGGCTTCSDVAQAVEKAPKEGTSLVVEAIQRTEAIADSICDKKQSTGRALLGKKGPSPPPPPPPPPCPPATAGSCMCAKTVKDLNIAIAVISTAINVASMSLGMAISFVKPNETKKKEDLEKANTALTAVNSNIVMQLQQIIGDGCPTCTTIVNGIQTGLTGMKATFTAAKPDWEKDPKFNAVFQAMQSLTGIVKGFCPMIDGAELLQAAPSSFVESSTCAQKTKYHSALVAISNSMRAAQMSDKLGEADQSSLEAAASLAAYLVSH